MSEAYATNVTGKQTEANEAVVNHRNEEQSVGIDIFEDETEKTQVSKTFVIVLSVGIILLLTALIAASTIPPKKMSYLPEGASISEVAGSDFTKGDKLDLNGLLERYVDYDEHSGFRWRSKDSQSWIILQFSDEKPSRILVSCGGGKVVARTVTESDKKWTCDMGSRTVELSDDAVRSLINAANEHFEDFEVI